MSEPQSYQGLYDPEHDVIRITTGDARRPVEGKEYGWGVVQLDADGVVVALEVRSAGLMVDAGRGVTPDFEARGFTGYGPAPQS